MRLRAAVAAAPGEVWVLSGCSSVSSGQYSLSVMYVAHGLTSICDDKLRAVLVNRRILLRVSYAGFSGELERERGKCRVCSLVLPMGG